MAAPGSTRAHETVRRLQDAITSGRWPVNSRIPNEAALAAELGVGRSTVREAVRSLAHLGMLEPAAGRGTFVRSLNPVRGVLSDFVAGHSWEDILTVRKALEIEATRLAAVRIDAAGLARLRAAHEADLTGATAAERGRTPGQFHAILIEIAGNGLLAEMYGALMSAMRAGLASGHLHGGQDAAGRQADHEALLAAVATGNPDAAGSIAAAHAGHDVVA